MEPITVLVALVGSVLALALRPIAAFSVYLFALFLYSQSLTVPLGPADFSVSRIIILPLLANIVFRSGLLKKFKWNMLDTFILLEWLGATLAYMANVPPITVLERQGGAFFDTVFAYFAARLVIRNRDDLIAFIKTMTYIGVPLGITACIESATGINVFGFMRRHYSFGLATDYIGPGEKRYIFGWGFYRAVNSFSHAIVFGLFFTMVAPLTLSVLKHRVWSRPKVLAAFGIICAGALASMSSAPYFALIFALMFIAVYRLRRYWVFPTALFLAALLFVEFYSNRHFYHVLTLLAFNQDTAYYRIGLIEEATIQGGMDGHWLAGYGFVGIGPGNDNSNFHWYHKDLVNVYIHKLARTGLLGMLPYLFINIIYFMRMYKARLYAKTEADKWMLWCIAAGLVGWNVALMTVSPLGNYAQFSSIMIAVSGNMPMVFRNSGASRVPVAAARPRTLPEVRRERRMKLRRRHA